MKRVIIVLLVLVAVAFAASQWRGLQAKRQAFEKAKAERAAELEHLRNQGRATPAPLVLPDATALASNEKNIAHPPGDSGRSNSVPQVGKDDTNVDANTAAEIAAAASLLAGKGQKVWQDPIARDALSFVGQDAEAEAIWVEAINNPDLPPKERKDLIEDLNEEGFADPKNLTLDDLPLILSRLALIEDYAPNAMDEVNAAAFAEAYKDLINMAARLVQR